VKLLLQVLPENRPSCGKKLLNIDQLLKHPYILKRIDSVKKAKQNDDSINNNLLQTIRVPKNLLVLTDRLPQKNYETNFTISNAENYPEIRNKTKSKGKIKKNLENYIVSNTLIDNPTLLDDEVCLPD
jgi:hypothetical protein